MRINLSRKIEGIDMKIEKPKCVYCLEYLEELSEWVETFVDSSGFEAKCESCGGELYVHPLIMNDLHKTIMFVVEKLEEDDYE